MPPANQVTDAEKAQIRRLHAEGKNCRQIATAIGRPPATVSVHAKAMGLTFDRSQTDAATDAKVADNRAARAKLIAWQYQRALKLAGRLDGDTWQTATRTQNGALTDVLKFVPTDDELSLARAIGQYAKTAAELEKVDTGSGAEAAKSMLSGVLDGLRSLYVASGMDGDAAPGT